MKLLKYIFVFLTINFGALAIGSWLMANGPQTIWYQDLNKAPWTPPGWVFGAAWTLIMICFSVYMGYLYKVVPKAKLIRLFGIQFILNIIWNYIFFNQHLIGLGLLTIVLLTIIVAKFLYDYIKVLTFKSILILPYLIWLCIATSLNAYILLNN
ncbi:TspO/MBR family protein [Flavivirga eckloniae]|uniref:TspO protein n=1 Tax=Flavivirga eckloniae TaxID=1803846 RepID=A0A2K9PMC3_9FLAO|nr:TspO/MBR family protein [Flavivirga eckloniae]AUP77988.1 TspO protein [Flavivirga eckloniae]